MGILRNKDPFETVGTVTRMLVMPGRVTDSDTRFLWFPIFSSKADNQDVVLFELNMDKLKEPFLNFMNAFLREYNSKFSKGAKSGPPVGDELSLREWPNFTILVNTHPFRVFQAEEFIDRFGDSPPESYHKKQFSILIFLDSNDVGKLYLINGRGPYTNFQEFFDLGISQSDEIGTSLWSISTNAPNTKSALFMNIHFNAGDSKFEKLIIGIPKRNRALEVGMMLSRLNLKG